MHSEPVSAWGNGMRTTGIRTADVFLFGCRLIWISSFLDVHNELALRLVLVHRTCRIVDLIAVNAVFSLAAPRT